MSFTLKSPGASSQTNSASFVSIIELSSKVIKELVIMTKMCQGYSSKVFFKLVGHDPSIRRACVFPSEPGSSEDSNLFFKTIQLPRQRIFFNIPEAVSASECGEPYMIPLQGSPNFQNILKSD